MPVSYSFDEPHGADDGLISLVSKDSPFFCYDKQFSLLGFDRKSSVVLVYSVQEKSRKCEVLEFLVIVFCLVDCLFFSPGIFLV